MTLSKLQVNEKGLDSSDDGESGVELRIGAPVALKIEDVEDVLDEEIVVFNGVEEEFNIDVVVDDEEEEEVDVVEGGKR
jgi:hypothetical protein